jgi:hypothetical protein
MACGAPVAYPSLATLVEVASRNRRRDGERRSAAVPDVGTEGALLVIVGLVVFALVVGPIPLFGVELIILGCPLAASLLGRVVLGRSWVIEAKLIAPPGRDRVLEWRVSGWRRSRRLIEEVVLDLDAGREPDPGSAR